MVYVRNVEVGTLRVNAGTGGALNNETDLLREIREALRGGAGDPTVVQAIQIENRRIIQSIENLARQMAGVPGAGAPPIGGGGGAGHGGGGGIPDETIKEFTAILKKLESAIVTFEGTTAGEHNKDNQGYFQREVALSRYGVINDLFRSLQDGSFSFKKTLNDVEGLVKGQYTRSAQQFADSILGAGLHATNLGSAFRQLHHEVVGMRESGVFGSNALTPMQYFLEGITRVREGILTTSDSFRSVLSLIGASLQRDVMSPLLTTGKSAAELAVDLHEARNDLRERGTDTRSFMSTKEANAALAAIVEQNLKSGVQSQFRSDETLRVMAQDQSFLRTIASMTGQTVGKLSEQLANSRQQQDVLLGLGRLSGDELNAFVRNQKYIETAGKSGQQLSDWIAQSLAAGRTLPEMMSANPEWAKLSALPGFLDKFMNLRELMMKSDTTQEEIRMAVRALGGQGAGGAIQGIGNNSPLQRSLLGGFENQVAAAVVTGTVLGNKPAATAAQKQAGEASPFMTMIQKYTEIFQEQVAPFLRLEQFMVGQIAALGANTIALWAVVGRLGMGGILGAAGTLVRAVGPVAGAGVAAGGAYMAGASPSGTMGAGAGALVGGLFGSMIGPWGTMIGTAAGGIIGGYLGQYLSSENAAHESESSRMTGYLGNQTAAIERAQMAGPESIAGYAENNSNMVGQLIGVTNDGNSTLGQILGELQKQTQYYTSNSESGSPPATPAAGYGLKANVQPRAMSRSDPSTPAT